MPPGPWQLMHACTPIALSPRAASTSPRPETPRVAWPLLAGAPPAAGLLAGALAAPEAAVATGASEAKYAAAAVRWSGVIAAAIGCITGCLRLPFA